jgi:nickel/cobalt transporter (NiCoT) family protein
MDAAFLALLMLAWALGARHGLDADHVAAIDALTRHNALARPRLAAASGALFAIGHGGVVLAVAAFATGLREAWSPPAWLEAAGAWTSITLLLVLGILNLRAAWARSGADAHAGPVGLKTRLFSRILRARHPASVAGVGAAFAVSFDTVSQTLLLVAAAATAGGVPAAMAACAMFVLGMLIVDGLGGLWACVWFRRGSGLSQGLARRLALVVGAMSIAMAALGTARLNRDAWQGWGEPHDLALTAALLLLPLALLAAHGWRRKPDPQEHA